MTAIILAARDVRMWFIFKTRKKQERERKLEEKEHEINEVKKKIVSNAADARDAVSELNKLVEDHGISGLIYFSTGKGRKK
jgi:hypothetical protein